MICSTALCLANVCAWLHGKLDNLARCITAVPATLVAILRILAQSKLPSSAILNALSPLACSALVLRPQLPRSARCSGACGCLQRPGRSSPRPGDIYSCQSEGARPGQQCRRGGRGAGRRHPRAPRPLRRTGRLRRLISNPSAAAAPLQSPGRTSCCVPGPLRPHRCSCQRPGAALKRPPAAWRKRLTPPGPPPWRAVR